MYSEMTEDDRSKPSHFVFNGTYSGRYSSSKLYTYGRSSAEYRVLLHMTPTYKMPALPCPVASLKIRGPHLLEYEDMSRFSLAYRRNWRIRKSSGIGRSVIPNQKSNAERELHEFDMSRATSNE